MIKTANLVNAILDGPFALTPRPQPVPGDLRLSWGIALVVLILGKSRGKRASVQKLHFLAHSIRSQQTRAEAQQVFARTLRPADILIRVEPWVNRALAFARGSGLIEMERGRSAKLIGQGLLIFEALYEDDSVLAEEKQFLDAVGPLSTEGAVDKIMKMELAL